jgi:quercetin dioxygenase-like cupin family protein
MSKSNEPEPEQLLDHATLELLANALRPVPLPLERMPGLRARVMERIDAEGTSTPAGFVTIRAAEGAWIEIAPKIHKKVLYSDPDTGVEAYLLRAEPGAEAPPHKHDHDEFCLVLEGQVDYADLHLNSGDYHFAPRGSTHSTATTRTGALLYLQTTRAA